MVQQDQWLQDLSAGIYGVTLTDFNGCESNLVLEVEVTDNQAPTATESPIVLEFPWQGDPIVIDPFLPDFFEDNCGIIGIIPSQSTFTCMDSGTNTIQVEVIDENGNNAIFMVIVNIIDNTPPEFIACPSVITDSGCNNLVDYQVAAIDDCNVVDYVLLEGLPTGSNFPLGQTDVTVAAIDFAGNEATCSFIVNIIDETPPAFATCPSSTTIDFCDNVFEYNVLAIDDCGFVDLQMVEGLPSGSIFPLGITHVVYEATDGSGNVSTCGFAVNVDPSWSLGVLDVQEPCFDENNGAIELALTGNLNEFNINWTPALPNTPLVENLAPGVYEAEVEGPNGCIQTIQVELQELPEIIISVDAIEHDMNNTSSGRIMISISGASTPMQVRWYLDGALFSTQEDLINIPAGTYSVILEDNNGCTAVLEDIVVEAVTGVEDLHRIDYQVFPNPSAGNFQVKMDADLLRTSTILLFDNQGREIPITVEINGSNASVEMPYSAPNGLYFLRINGLDFKVAERMLLVR